MPRGLLVTGLPRSGTSWVGKMLEASGRLVYVNEPMNPSHPPGRSPGVLDASVEHYFHYICDDNADPWRAAFTDTLGLRYRLGRELATNRRPYDLARAARYATLFAAGRLRRHGALLDDPYALFSAGWLARTYDIPAVVLIREPVAFVGAWRAHHWTVDSGELLSQPLLMRDHLEPSRDELTDVAGSSDWLASTAALWNATYRAVDKLVRTDDRLHLVRYEDLVADPVGGFRDLYARVGLAWSPAASRRIVAATTTPDNAPTKRFRWSLRDGLSKTAYRPMSSASALDSYRARLTDDEIQRTRDLTEAVRASIYAA